MRYSPPPIVIDVSHCHRTPLFAGTCTRRSPRQRICMTTSLSLASLLADMYLSIRELLKLQPPQVSSFGTLCVSSDSAWCPLSKSLMDFKIRRAVRPYFKLPPGTLYFRHYEVGRAVPVCGCMAEGLLGQKSKVQYTSPLHPPPPNTTSVADTISENPDLAQA